MSNNDGRLPDGTGLSSVGSSQQAVSPVPASIPDAQWAAILHLLQNFPADGKPMNQGAARDALFLGLVQIAEVNRSCPTCGHMALDYTYYRMTQAGRIVLALAQGIEARQGQDGNRPDRNDESPVACDAPLTPIEGTSHAD